MTVTLSVAALVGRYRFQFPPSLDRPWKEIEGTILEFREGFLETAEALIAISQLDLYSDGLGVQCNNTEDAETVVNDLVSWAQETQGFRPFIRPPLKLFFSQIIVRFEKPIEGLFDKWAQIQRLLSEPIRKHYGIDQPASVNTLSFKCDPMTVLHANLMSEFGIERRVNEKFAEDRYFCKAPLPTSEHVALLERIEALA